MSNGSGGSESLRGWPNSSTSGRGGGGGGDVGFIGGDCDEGDRRCFRIGGGAVESGEEGGEGDRGGDGT